MQMPVFLTLFFAPVYVPLALLTGWIETVATLNPITYVLEAVRSMLAGDEDPRGTRVRARDRAGRGLLVLGAARPALGGGGRLGRVPSRRVSRHEIAASAPFRSSPGRSRCAPGLRRRARWPCAWTSGDHPLTETDDGVWEGHAPAAPGDDYRFVLDGGDAWPDPCSRWQPEGVRGPSRVLDTTPFEIEPGPALALEELVLYELHVGTFSRDGHVRRRDPAPRRAARARRHRDRADAGGDLPGQPRLGVRRALSLRTAPGLRRPGRAGAARRRRAP